MTTRVLQQYILDAEKAFERHEWLEGRDLLHEALEMEPVFAKAHNHLGWLYLYYLIDYNLSEMHLKLALKYAPGYHAPYLHMAQLLFDTGKWEELERLLNKAMGISGVQKSFIYNDLGRLHEVKGEYRKAITNYKLAIRYSFDTKEIDTFRDNIKRSRNKRWVLFW